MGFAISTEKEKLQERAIRGKYLKAAVGCWFTSSGKAMPQIVKYEDDDGCIQILRDIHVINTTQKYYAGIQSRKYDCSVIVDQRKQEFTLLYNPETGQWNMVLAED